MSVRGNTWQYMVIHGNIRQYMTYIYYHTYMVIDGYTWYYMALHGSTW